MFFLEQGEHVLLSSYVLTKNFLTTVPAEILEEISERKVLHSFRFAAKHVPAYGKFLTKHKVKAGEVHSIEDFHRLVPFTDKENYIKKYSFEQRSKFGRLPKTGNVDESGGSSGVATNWIHDFHEESLLFKAVKFEVNYAFKRNSKDELFVLSGWSCGPWATGVKFCELMERLTLVKNTGTDPKDIVRTLKMFGTKHHYLIGAYPPFVKQLIDEYSKEINWKKYDIDLVIGGEGVTLEWVKYMKSKLRKGARIVSSYGASDIDIGVGFETPFAFFIRELIAKNAKFRKELLGRDDVPMIFQYNPLMHYLHSVEHDGKKEFEVTLLDRKAALSKIKYNIHDEGEVVKYNEMLALLSKYYPDFWKKFASSGGDWRDVLHLPFLCIFGRSDGTLSFDGANVFPHQIESGIMGKRGLGGKTKRFKIEKKHDHKHDVQFHIHVELQRGHKSSRKLAGEFEKVILDELISINPDFKESYSNNKTLRPKVNLYVHGHSFFSEDDKKVKNSYILKQKKEKIKQKGGR